MPGAVTSELVACACCGEQTRQFRAPQPEPSGPPDFDTRPGEPERSRQYGWVSRCEFCGYCADDLSAQRPAVCDAVQSEEYQALLADDFFPALARTFLCYALLLSRMHRWADSGWSCLHAAWACDDAGNDRAATQCRTWAIERWRRAKELGESFGDDIGSEFALVADVYRRVGMFEEATVACTEGLDVEDLPPMLEQILRRQLVLTQTRATAAYSLATLLEPPKH